MKKLLILGASTFLINSTVLANDSSITNEFDILASPDNSVHVKLAGNEHHSFQDEADKINDMIEKKESKPSVPKKHIATKSAPKIIKPTPIHKIIQAVSQSHHDMNALSVAQDNSDMMHEFYKKIAAFKSPEIMTKIPPQLQTTEPLVNTPVSMHAVVAENVQKIATSLQHPKSVEINSNRVVTASNVQVKSAPSLKPTAIETHPIVVAESLPISVPAKAHSIVEPHSVLLASVKPKIIETHPVVVAESRAIAPVVSSKPKVIETHPVVVAESRAIAPVVSSKPKVIETHPVVVAESRAIAPVVSVKPRTIEMHPIVETHSVLLSSAKPTTLKTHNLVQVASHQVIPAHTIKSTTIKSFHPKVLEAKEDVHVNLPSYSTKITNTEQIHSVKPVMTKADLDANASVDKIKQRIREETRAMSDDNSTRPITSASVETLLETAHPHEKPSFAMNTKLQKRPQPKLDTLKTRQRNSNDTLPHIRSVTVQNNITKHTTMPNKVNARLVDIIKQSEKTMLAYNIRYKTPLTMNIPEENLSPLPKKTLVMNSPAKTTKLQSIHKTKQKLISSSLNSKSHSLARKHPIVKNKMAMNKIVMTHHPKSTKSQLVMNHHQQQPLKMKLIMTHHQQSAQLMKPKLIMSHYQSSKMQLKMSHLTKRKLIGNHQTSIKTKLAHHQSSRVTTAALNHHSKKAFILTTHKRTVMSAKTNSKKLLLKTHPKHLSVKHVATHTRMAMKTHTKPSLSMGKKNLQHRYSRVHMNHFMKPHVNVAHQTHMHRLPHQLTESEEGYSNHLSSQLI